MRYEGVVKVMGLMNVVIDEPGLTLEKAKERIECEPGHFKRLFVEVIQFEEWEEDLRLTETDNEP